MNRFEKPDRNQCRYQGGEAQSQEDRIARLTTRLGGPCRESQLAERRRHQETRSHGVRGDPRRVTHRIAVAFPDEGIEVGPLVGDRPDGGLPGGGEEGQVLVDSPGIEEGRGEPQAQRE